MPAPPDRWREIERLFGEAADLPPTERSAYLDHACAHDPTLLREVESLLESDQQRQQGFIERKVAHAAALAVQTPPAQRRAGPYELLREIGRGGMGSVYLARRADDEYDTQVAIKLVRPGMDTDFLLQRFRRERQILASFQHPHIARLLDGGTTPDGLPYIVMEYIDGRRITEYVQQEALTLDSRIRLFLDVCEAVEYAHRRFVVHRDLKPGNILVDSTGSVKLLDFGICKLLYSDFEDTAAGVTPLTPDYASPEQVRGEAVTIASDIYSLGAVLYELLTGSKPHRILHYSPRAVEEAICEQPTDAPSAVVLDPSLRKRLSGDLDTILLHAMHKEPERRYGSAAEFADDLRRYLDHLPVRARKDSVWYRSRKFLRRHRALAFTGALAFAGLAAAAVTALQDARHQRQNALETRRLAGSLLVEVHDALQDAPGATRARRLLVQSALSYLARLAPQAANDPQLQGELVRGWTRLGDAQGGSFTSSEGDMRAALDSYHRALQLLPLPPLSSPDHLRTRASLLRRIAELEAYTRSPAEALAHFHEARRLVEPLLPGAARDLAETLMGASRLERLAAQPEAARDSAARAEQLLLPLFTAAPADPDLRRLRASSLSLKGMAELRLGNHEEALSLFRLALDTAQPAASQPALRREAMLAWLHIADAWRQPALNQPAEALAASERVVELARSLVEHDPTDLRARNEFGNALSRLAAAAPPARRLPLYLQAREQLSVIAEAHPDNRSNLFHLAVIEERLGNESFRAGSPSRARQWWQTAAATARRAASAAASQQRPEEAQRLNARAQALDTRQEPAH